MLIDGDLEAVLANRDCNTAYSINLALMADSAKGAEKINIPELASDPWLFSRCLFDLKGVCLGFARCNNQRSTSRENGARSTKRIPGPRKISIWSIVSRDFSYKSEPDVHRVVKTRVTLILPYL